jgi:hypothetical protein
MLIEVNPLHCWNTALPITETDEGMFTEVKPVHPENENLPKSVIEEGRTIVFRLSFPL